MVEEEDTSPAVETAVDMLMPPIVDVGHQQALGAVAGPTVVPPHVAPVARQRMVADPMVAVRDRMVAVADRMVAASDTSWHLLNLPAHGTRSSGAYQFRRFAFISCPSPCVYRFFSIRAWHFSMDPTPHTTNPTLKESHFGCRRAAGLLVVKTAQCEEWSETGRN
jgi:hypothetical protein